MELRRKDLKSDPFEQLAIWLREAVEADITEPTAMMLATATATGQPSLRAVLLKQCDAEGLVFYTDYRSRKSMELAENPNAALLFLWTELDREVCVEGKVEKVTAAESDTYYARRSRESQIGRWASHQGQAIASREALEDVYADMEARFADQPVPRPEWWGGWRVIPSRFEFWQGRPHRFHDRFQYLLKDGAWVISRLSP